MLMWHIFEQIHGTESSLYLTALPMHVCFCDINVVCSNVYNLFSNRYES